MIDSSTYKRIFCIDVRACQALYSIVCALLKSEEYSDGSGEGTLEALLITLVHYWLNGDDGELYRAVECLKTEDADEALVLQRLSKLDEADYPELAESIHALKFDFPNSWTYYVDDIDLDDNKHLVRLTLVFHTPGQIVHSKMENLKHGDRDDRR